MTEDQFTVLAILGLFICVVIGSALLGVAVSPLVHGESIKVDLGNSTNFWDNTVYCDDELIFTDSTGLREYKNVPDENCVYWVEVTETLTVSEPVTAYVYYGEKENKEVQNAIYIIIALFIAGYIGWHIRGKQ
ncbi:hypothetical protein LCGC14_0978790 [marine sediment metagenome]|uniref:Uncharacterized protein n=1 Tax=marine sediment metagenome TaxID=412755 RepID=A0A0F9NVL6_9ZZZZ